MAKIALKNSRKLDFEECKWGKKVLRKNYDRM